MPVMDGVGFLRELRARGAGGRIPVVVLSAAAEQCVAFQAGALGAGDYLVKSRVSLEDMVARVGRALTPDGSPAAGPTATSAHAAVPPMRPVDPRLVHLRCPRKTCGWVMSVEPDLRGTRVTCTHCGGPLRVPPQKDIRGGGGGAAVRGPVAGGRG